MGCACRKMKKLGHQDYAILASQTHFSETDIKSLRVLFKKLSSSLIDDGFITKEEFQLGLFKNSKKQNLFADRIFDLFDFKHDNVIEFEEFVHSLSIFHPLAPTEDKALFAFRLYDTRKRGFILPGEVKELICTFLTESDLILCSDIIDLIIKKTFEDVDSKKDGCIDLDEWKSYVAINPSVLKNMTIPYLKDITTAFPSFRDKPEIEDETNY